MQRSSSSLSGWGPSVVGGGLSFWWTTAPGARSLPLWFRKPHFGVGGAIRACSLMIGSAAPPSRRSIAARTQRCWSWPRSGCDAIPASATAPGPGRSARRRQRARPVELAREGLAAGEIDQDVVKPRIQFHVAGDVDLRQVAAHDLVDGVEAGRAASRSERLTPRSAARRAAKPSRVPRISMPRKPRAP